MDLSKRLHKKQRASLENHAFSSSLYEKYKNTFKSLWVREVILKRRVTKTLPSDQIENLVSMTPTHTRKTAEIRKVSTKKFQAQGTSKAYNKQTPKIINWQKVSSFVSRHSNVPNGYLHTSKLQCLFYISVFTDTRSTELINAQTHIIRSPASPQSVSLKNFWSNSEHKNKGYLYRKLCMPRPCTVNTKWLIL